MSHDHHEHPRHRHDPSDAHDAHDTPPLADLLDLDAEVSRSALLAVTDWIAQLIAEPPRRIVDLGAGTGTGTLALAQRFEGADVLAVDVSPSMLTRVAGRAAASGVADRVHTVEADLDQGWPDVGSADLVWAALSLHELAHPALAFAGAFAALRPAGLLVVVELDTLPRFLPEDIGIGRPGLEARCHDALDRVQQGNAAHPDWSAPLDAAGFTDVVRRRFGIDLPEPQPAATGRYAQAYLRRIRGAIAPHLAVDDLSTLDVLLDDLGPHSLLHRDDLVVNSSRTAWVARRP